MSSAAQIRNAVVRLSIGQHHGTGVFVSPNAILTARHVITNGEGSVYRPKDVLIENLQWFGRCEADEIAVARRPEVDLAVLYLRPPKSGAAERCLAIASQPTQWVNVGEQVDVAGFSTLDRDLETDVLRVMSIDRVAGAYQCNKSVARGYSGSPVVVGATLVGILYARNHDAGCSYFCGGESLSTFVKEHVSNDVVWRDEAISPLRKYPLGPAVSQDIVLARLHKVMPAYIRIHTHSTASATIAAANAERLKCGPPSDPQKALIPEGELPNPHFDPYAYWVQAFRVAGLKSPRMLAALLRAVSADRLTNEENQERAAFLHDLETWGQRST
jgi:hypothetical protein